MTDEPVLPERQAAGPDDAARTLLRDLAAQGHPAAEPLTRAWALHEALTHAGFPSLPAVPLHQLTNSPTHQPTPPISPSPPTPLLSIVLPVFNEEVTLPELYRRLRAVLEPLGSYEIVFVNDGSTDDSGRVLRELRAADPSVKVVELSRNFGHQAAITAGMDYSRGQAVAILDADLQDPPELLPEMLAKWREGFQVVYMVRAKRAENLAKRAAYRLFYRLLHALATIDIPLDSGDFCLMDRVVVDHMKRLPERNRFVRGLRSWVGYRQVAIPYSRAARHAGGPKYTLAKLVRLALDGLVSFSSFPLRLAAYVGLASALGGVVYLLYALGERVFLGNPPPGWTSTVVLILMLGGIQLLLMGVLGEYIARIFDESKQRPSYIAREFLD